MVKQVNGLSEPGHARLAGSRQSRRLAGPCGRRRDTLRTPARSPPAGPGHSSTSTIPTAPSRPWAPDRTVTRQSRARSRLGERHHQDRDRRERRRDRIPAQHLNTGSQRHLAHCSYSMCTGRTTRPSLFLDLTSGLEPGCAPGAFPIRAAARPRPSRGWTRTLGNVGEKPSSANGDTSR